MIGRRLTHLAAFALLAAATALLANRIVQPPIGGELLAVAGLAILVGLPGLVHRRLALASVLLVPLGAYLLLRVGAPLPPLSHGFAAQQSYYGDLLRDGMRAYGRTAFPLTMTGATSLHALVLLAVYGVVALSSVLALGLRQMVLGAVPLLGFAAYCLTVDGAAGSTTVGLGFVALVALALLTSHSLKRRRWSGREIAIGLVIGGLALTAGWTILDASPGLAKAGWQDWKEWRLFDGGARSTVLFDWNQNYPRLLDPQRDYPLMHVTSPVPSYWRANTLNTFDGMAWISSNNAEVPVESSRRTVALPEQSPVPPGTEAIETFELSGVVTDFVFSGGVATYVNLGRDFTLAVSDAGAMRLSRPLRPPFVYQLAAVVPQVDPEALVGLGADYPEALGERYLTLPIPSAAEVDRLQAAGEDWQAAIRAGGRVAAEFTPIYELNRSIVGDAADPYQKLLRIEAYLRGSTFSYTLSPPGSRLRSPYAAFLFDTHQGYCQHFAGAMALFARLNGIPARVAVGFFTGTRYSFQDYLVSTNNAHSWVEVYFPTVGWLPFDPTPGRNLPQPGPSLASEGFVDPFAETSTTGTTVPLTPPTTLPRTPPPDAGGGVSASTGSRSAWKWLPIVLLAGVAAWPLVRWAVRERRARRGSPDQRLRAALELLRGDLRDRGMPASPAATWDELRTAVLAELRIDLRDLAERWQAVAYGGRPATVRDVAHAQAARGRIRRAHRHRRGWARTVRAWYGVPRLPRARWERLLRTLRLRPERA